MEYRLFTIVRYNYRDYNKLINYSTITPIVFDFVFFTKFIFTSPPLGLVTHFSLFSTLFTFLTSFSQFASLPVCSHCCLCCSVVVRVS
jgi:hypothetical protein